ncbi:MAG: type II secretion system F family protein [Acidobacteria bacterium]|nr:type II secretion system F family protein [Acidobacteriota bacterium]
MITILYFLACAITFSAIAWSGLVLLQPKEEPLGDRLDELQKAAGAATVQRGPKRRLGGGFWESILYFVSALGGEDFLRDIEKSLREAGIRRREATAMYVLFNLLVMLALIAGALYLQRDGTLTDKLLALIAPVLLGYLLPRQVLYRLVARYKAKLQEALPDTIDLLGIVLGTGLALDQAMIRVSEEMQYIYPELANEFYTVVMQVKAGQERSRAFNALVRRTGIDDIKSLAAMIIQSERFGTSLSKAMKVYADELRMRRRLRAESAIAKAGIKMLFPIIIFIFPVLFAITLGPAMISVLRGLSGGIGQPR